MNPKTIDLNFFDFTPTFFIMDKNRNKMYSIAVKFLVDGIYKGIWFKEDNTGWDSGPISIGKDFISHEIHNMEMTNDFNEAKKHASVCP